MEATTECKGCSENVRITREEIYEKYVKPLNLNKTNTVTDEEYKKRLKICFDCSGLEYGTTCRYCGCLVQVRAKLKKSTCPYPFEPKWN